MAMDEPTPTGGQPYPPQTPGPYSTPGWGAAPQAAPTIAGPTPYGSTSGGRPPRLALISGVVLILISLASCGVGVAGFGRFASDIQNRLSSAQRNPAGSTVTVSDTAGWTLMFATSMSMQCTVTDQNGNTVNGSLGTDGEQISESFAEEGIYLLDGFDAVSSFTYDITCGEISDSGNFRVVTVPGLSGLKRGLAGFAGGLLALVIGVICLIVGFVRRRKWKRSHYQFPSSGQSPWPPAGPPTPGGLGTPMPPGGFNPPQPLPGQTGYSSPQPAPAPSPHASSPMPPPPGVPAPPAPGAPASPAPPPPPNPFDGSPPFSEPQATPPTPPPFGSGPPYGSGPSEQ